MVESARNRVLALWDDDKNGVSLDDERAELVFFPNQPIEFLSHGLYVDEKKGFLYATT